MKMKTLKEIYETILNLLVEIVKNNNIDELNFLLRILFNKDFKIKDFNMDYFDLNNDISIFLYSSKKEYKFVMYKDNLYIQNVNNNKIYYYFKDGYIVSSYSFKK